PSSRTGRHRNRSIRAHRARRSRTTPPVRSLFVSFYLVSRRVTKTMLTEAGDNPMSVIPRMFLRFEHRVPQMGRDVARDLVEAPVGGFLVDDTGGLDPVEPERAAAVAQPTPGHEVPVPAAAHEPIGLDLAGLGGGARAVDVVEFQHPVT